MDKPFRTAEDCDTRYIPIVKAVESTNTWIKLVSTITVLAFWFCVTIIKDINSNIESIKVSLQHHEVNTLKDVSILKVEVENLKIAIKK